MPFVVQGGIVPTSTHVPGSATLSFAGQATGDNTRLSLTYTITGGGGVTFGNGASTVLTDKKVDSGVSTVDYVATFAGSAQYGSFFVTASGQDEVGNPVNVGGAQITVTPSAEMSLAKDRLAAAAVHEVAMREQRGADAPAHRVAIAAREDAQRHLASLALHPDKARRAK